MIKVSIFYKINDLNISCERKMIKMSIWCKKNDFYTPFYNKSHHRLIHRWKKIIPKEDLGARWEVSSQKTKNSLVGNFGRERMEQKLVSLILAATWQLGKFKG